MSWQKLWPGTIGNRKKIHTTFGFCTATDHNPAFVLVDFTILWVHPPSVGPTLPHSLPASCNHSLCQLLLYLESQTYSLTDWVTHTHPQNDSLTHTLTDPITNSLQWGIHTWELPRWSSVIASVTRPWDQPVLFLYQRGCNVQKEVSIC